jgi:hypothetical protein
LIDARATVRATGVVTSASTATVDSAAAAARLADHLTAAARSWLAANRSRLAANLNLTAARSLLTAAAATAMMTVMMTATALRVTAATIATAAMTESSLNLFGVEHQASGQQEGKAGDARNNNTIHGKPPKGNPNTLRFIREPLGSDRRLPYLQPSGTGVSCFRC